MCELETHVSIYIYTCDYPHWHPLSDRLIQELYKVLAPN